MERLRWSQGDIEKLIHEGSIIPKGDSEYLFYTSWWAINVPGTHDWKSVIAYILSRHLFNFETSPGLF